MTKGQESTTLKWGVGIFLTIFLAMMSVQTAATSGLREDMQEFMLQNNSDHLRIEKALLINYEWTHSVHEYEIKPNSEFRKEYKKKFDSIINR